MLTFKLALLLSVGSTFGAFAAPLPAGPAGSGLLCKTQADAGRSVIVLSTPVSVGTDETGAEVFIRNIANPGSLTGGTEHFRAACMQSSGAIHCEFRAGGFVDVDLTSDDGEGHLAGEFKSNLLRPVRSIRCVAFASADEWISRHALPED